MKWYPVGAFAWLRAKLGTMHGRKDTDQGSDVDHVRSVQTYVMDSDGNFWCPATGTGLLNAKVLAPSGAPIAVNANGAGVTIPLADADYDAFIVMNCYNDTVGAETLEWTSDPLGAVPIAADTVWAAQGYAVPPSALMGVLLAEAYATWTTGAAGSFVIVQRYKYQ